MPKKIFRDWRTEKIDHIPGLITKPGMYLLHSKAFGVKGVIGKHSWIAISEANNKFNLVAEVTDLETVKVQGGRVYNTSNMILEESIQQPMLLSRDASQMWFGSIPVVSNFIQFDTTKANEFLSHCIHHYPYRYKKFNLVTTNCNAFCSWIFYNLNKHFGIIQKPNALLIGWKSFSYWKNHEACK